MSVNEIVTSEIQNKICTISFFNPKGNSLTTSHLLRLTKEFNDVSYNENINVIVLKSEGNGAFCGGASIDELMRFDRFEKAKEFFFAFGKLLLTMIRCTKPIIARVHGKIVGGGIGLVSACDYAIAKRDASLRLSELTIGIGPFVISPFLIKKIGISAFTHLSLDTQWRDAEWGKMFGLYSKVVQTTEELDNEVNKLTADLSMFSLKSLAKLKEIFWEKTDNWDQLIDERAEISARLILSEIASGRLQKIMGKNES
ncbi:MAG: enoyl-CoA hydratase/isomerase family protein [Ignavibacteria bacterium]|nr:enoyl-CoA hydratase/isomerase family protein [Ignavibacteria bacterium]